MANVNNRLRRAFCRTARAEVPTTIDLVRNCRNRSDESVQTASVSATTSATVSTTDSAIRRTSFVDALSDPAALTTVQELPSHAWDSSRSLDKISLTPEELEAFSEYIFDSDPMNMALIENKEMTEDAARMDCLLSGVFLKAKDIPANEPVITYKGLRNKEKERFLGNLEVGSIVAPNYFFRPQLMSTLQKEIFYLLAQDAIRY